MGAPAAASPPSTSAPEQNIHVLADLIGVPARLADGARVRARIILSDKASVHKVPASAVFQSGDGFAVYALVGNQARRVDVLPGTRNASEVEILAGLAEDAIVIVDPPAALKDGSRVVSRKAKVSEHRPKQNRI